MARGQRIGLFTARFVLAILFLLADRGVSQAANWYVLKGATGTNNGTSWTNAWTEMNQVSMSSVSCGDTIWIAGNNGGAAYSTTLAVSKTCTSSTVLNIKRATAGDAIPVAAAGWNATFDSQVVILNAEITPTGGAYITIDGRTGSVVGPSINTTFGISIQCTNSGGCEGMGCGNGGGSNCVGNLDHLTLTHIEVFGPSCILVGGGGSGACNGETDGINFAPGSNAVTNCLFDHIWVHRWAELIRTSNWTGNTIQYSGLDTTNPTAGLAEHEDVIYSYPNTNFTVRYNRIGNSPNDGIFFDFGGTTNFQFYGNYYYHMGNAAMTFKSGYSFGTAFIYNNVWESDPNSPGSNGASLNFNGTMSGGALEDNVFENVTVNGASQMNTSDYNAYSTNIGKQDSGTHSFTYDPGTMGASVDFVSEAYSPWATADFHLTATGQTAMQNGVTLSAPFNQDPDGSTRGASGNWYIGAYQYSGSQSQAPQAPTGLVVAVQ